MFNNNHAIKVEFDGKEEDFNAINEEEEQEESKGGLSENVGNIDLMTSSPILNKKKML
jgi:hypothetical protein